ncbi:hypothetical protein OU995_02995 [Roseateles sp. SL47]|uniref:hypothetical protein n=1 Tax=Roseateles sp. SL47 TaxID=2995138 RepID=UPI0022704F78|nr:hypothetical protein [Roseateles sp. SL47]WAC73725.1 hypothetical protein OU995_02995 [Roseateles sp. SL47]
MKTFFKTMLVLGLLMVLASMAISLVAFGALSDAPGVHIQINGDDWSAASMGAGDLLGAFLALVVCGLVLCVVVPLLLLLGIGLPLLIFAGLLVIGLAAVLGAGAVLGSPMLLIVLIVWLLVRDRSPRARRQARHAGHSPSPEPTLPA